MTTEKTIRFIKGYPKFAYLMSNDAVYFMMHMVDIEFLRRGNYNTHRWFKGEYVRRMNMKVKQFNRCVTELETLGLLKVTRRINGNGLTYTLNQMAYRKLLKVCAATIHYDRIKDFLTKLKAEGRLIRDVSDYEISTVKGYSKSNYSEAPYVKFYPGFSYLLTPDEICLLMHIFEIEYLAKYSICSFRTKRDFLDKTNMEPDAFDKAVNNLHRLRLIMKTTDDAAGTIYKHSYAGYSNLVKVCGATYNYKALKEYFDWLIVKGNRTLWDVRHWHFEALEEYGNHYSGMEFPFSELPAEEEDES